MSSESLLKVILNFSECNRINNLQRVDAPLSGASKSRFTEGGRARMVHRRRLDESVLKDSFCFEDGSLAKLPLR